MVSNKSACRHSFQRYIIILVASILKMVEVLSTICDFAEKLLRSKKINNFDTPLRGQKYFNIALVLQDE